jgi:hypothetical protein
MPENAIFLGELFDHVMRLWKRDASVAPSASILEGFQKRGLDWREWRAPEDAPDVDWEVRTLEWTTAGLQTKALGVVPARCRSDALLKAFMKFQITGTEQQQRIRVARLPTPKQSGRAEPRSRGI